MADPEPNRREPEQPLPRRERRAWQWWFIGILVLAVVLAVGLMLLPLAGEGVDPVPEEAIGETEGGAGQPQSGTQGVY